MPSDPHGATIGAFHVQLGLFGDGAEVAGMHVVMAHTRVLADGNEVFVGEHLRWNRGRQARLPRVRVRAVAPTDQPGLFDGWVVPPVTDPCLDEVEVFPGAVQLPLWRRAAR